jgi:hypothetical protein
VNHYAPRDYEKAERRFVKFCLNHGPLADSSKDRY